MIKKECTSKEWIISIANSQKADKILVEKVVRALLLLEGLSESQLPFVFKGGTALMLLLGAGKRLSIDIDIIVPEKEDSLSSILEVICKQKEFTHFVQQERKVSSQIEKEHYKVYFHSEIENKESYVLLDVLKERVHYQRTIKIPIDNIFIDKTKDKIPKVTVPDFDNILGDKLTAFAPNTTGIPYQKGNKEMGMEIIKQMYDIGTLCDYASNPSMFASVFKTFAETEIQYRGNLYTVDDVLEDILDNAMSTCLRKKCGNTDYDILTKGITQIKSFIFSESFHLEKAINYATKVIYIVSLIKYKATEMLHFTKDSIKEMKDWKIGEPMSTKLNKLKKTDIEAFFYVYQAAKLMNEKSK